MNASIIHKNSESFFVVCKKNIQFIFGFVVFCAGEAALVRYIMTFGSYDQAIWPSLDFIVGLSLLNAGNIIMLLDVLWQKRKYTEFDQ